MRASPSRVPQARGRASGRRSGRSGEAVSAPPVRSAPVPRRSSRGEVAALQRPAKDRSRVALRGRRCSSPGPRRRTQSKPPEAKAGKKTHARVVKIRAGGDAERPTGSFRRQALTIHRDAQRLTSVLLQPMCLAPASPGTTSGRILRTPRPPRDGSDRRDRADGRIWLATQRDNPCGNEIEVEQPRLVVVLCRQPEIDLRMRERLRHCHRRAVS
jgi:hypothetical protein